MILDLDFNPFSVRKKPHSALFNKPCEVSFSFFGGIVCLSFAGSMSFEGNRFTWYLES
jgi:hypothetical protein